MHSKYTFLLPAYKARYFEKALLSIKNQTYYEFSVIVSDDCSPEPLLSIFQNAVGNDSRFSYWRNEKNMGSISLVSHWNQLVKECESDYLIMASDDDLYDSNFLYEINLLVEKYPNVDILRARSQVIDETGSVILEDTLPVCLVSQSQFLYNLVKTVMNPSLANYVFKTEKLKNIGGFVDFPLAWGSDEATVLKMSSNGVVSPSPILFSFRQSGLNISSIKNSMIERKKYEARKQYLSFLESFINSIVCSTNQETVCVEYFKKEYISRMMNQVLYQSSFLSYRELYGHVRFLQCKGAFKSKFDVLKYLWTWIRLKQQNSR